MEVGRVSIDCAWTQLKSHVGNQETFVAEAKRLSENHCSLDVIKYALSKLESKVVSLEDVDMLHHLLDVLDTDWCFKTEKDYDLKILCKLVSLSVQYGSVPSFEGREDHSYSVEDFQFVAERALVSMQLIIKLCQIYVTKKVIKPRGRTNEIGSKQVSPMTSDWLDSNISNILIVCICHQKSNMWTSLQSEESSKELLNTLNTVYHVADIKELLFGNSHLTEGLLKKILLHFQATLTRNTWSHHPGMWSVYEWCLEHTKFPNLSGHLEQFLPPALLFVDDYKTNSKVRGVGSLQHIIDNVSSSELIRYGRAQVIYSALSHLLYTQEAELLHVLLPCLLSILRIIEAVPRNCGTSRQKSRYDEIFLRVLSSMEMEDKIRLRQIYSCHLIGFLEVMGISILKLFKRLLRVIFNYLEIYDGPKEHSRLNILICLRTVIVTAWVRIPDHCEDIFRGLFKLVYDLSIDETTTPKETKKSLLNASVECMVLVKLACGYKMDLILTQMMEVQELNSVCEECLQKVIDAI